MDASMVVTGCDARSVAARSDGFRAAIGMTLEKVNHVKVGNPREVKEVMEGCEWGIDALELHLAPAPSSAQQLSVDKQGRGALPLLVNGMA